MTFNKHLQLIITPLYSKGVFIILLILFKFSGLYAQLTFPNGNSLNLVTNVSFMYEETVIKFHTGKFKVSDYNWMKVSDSINQNWWVSSCFNGECKGDLPFNGDFIMDYGYNDTTGFIAFHVNTKDSSGTSKIAYSVQNKSDFSDVATLFYTITYNYVNGIIHTSSLHFKVYPNPVSDYFVLDNPEELKIQDIHVYDIMGREQKVELDFSKSNQIAINAKALKSGVWFLSFQTADGVYNQKIIKE